jgi:hypothetical protein
MPRNIYISHGTTSEQNLLADIIEESIAIYGHDVFYIPRKIVKLDGVLNEDTLSNFPDAYMIEMYVESIDGFEGDGKLITKFGLEIRDQLTLICSVRRWNQLVGRFGYPEEQVKPREGDLIYFPMSKGLFEIKYVDDKKPFYQLNNLPMYRMTLELFEYNNQKLDTGITEIDDIQSYSSQGFTIVAEYDVGVTQKFARHDTLVLTFGSGINGSCEVLRTEETADPLKDKVFIGPITYDNGVFRPIAPGTVMLNETTLTSATIDSVAVLGIASDDDINRNDKVERNSTFELEGNAFIDFSEANPFGEIQLP